MSHQLGQAKIGQVGLRGAKEHEAGPGDRTPTLPARFDRLPATHFSLGQDDSYYATLGELGDTLREFVLSGMRDIAYDTAARRVALSEKVTTTSLLRTVTTKTVEDQFARMAHGGERLTPYEFTFRPKSTDPRPGLRFSVTPGSRPPSNIHVLIGRNGVGKSTLLNDMARAWSSRSREDEPRPGPWDQLSNIVSVSFSAFDDFTPANDPSRAAARPDLPLRRPEEGRRTRGPARRAQGRASHPHRDDEVAEDWRLVGARRARLRKALGLLEERSDLRRSRPGGHCGSPDAAGGRRRHRF